MPVLPSAGSSTNQQDFRKWAGLDKLQRTLKGTELLSLFMEGFLDLSLLCLVALEMALGRTG